MEKSLYILLPVILMFVVGCSRHSISPSDGGKVSFSSSLSSNTVSSIQRDSLGYLWIGTDRGINIFDGTNYRQLRHDRLDTASLRSDNVLKIYRGNAHMWVMTDQGIDCYAGNGRFVHYHSNAVSSRAACMIERKDGRVIALFGNELCELEGWTFKRKLSIAGTFHGLDGAIVDDHSGRLLINSNQGLFLVDKDLTKSVLFLKGNNNVVCADSETVCHLSFTQGIVYLRRKDFSILYRSGESMPVVANSAVFWHGEVIFSGNDGLYRITHHGNDHAYTVESLPADIIHDSNHQFIKTMYADPKGDLWIGYIMRGLRHLQNMEAWHRRLASDRAFKHVIGKAVVGVVSGNNGEVWGALANDSVFHIDGHTDSVVALPLAGLMPIHSQQHIKGIAFSAGEFWVVTTSNVFALHFDNGIKLDEFYDVGLVQRDVCGRHVSIPNGLVVMAGIDRLIVFDALHRKEEVKDIRVASNRLPVAWQIGDFTVMAKMLAGVNFSSVSNVIAGNNHILISEGLNAWKSINLLTGKVMDTSLPLNANIISSSYQGSHLFLGTDADKVIKVFDNLLTNAIRHTPQHGAITVTLQRLNDSMVLSVENSGNQIPETQIRRIFEQYYRLDDTVATWGAGLGLHYVKSLVTLHHGQIAATNTDTGVCFTVSLPIDEAAYTEKEKVSRHQNINSYDMNGEGEDEDILRPKHHEEPGLAPEDSRPRLLIVEKDINTAFFLRHLFEGKYNVFNRYEGAKAFNDIDEIKPDIILSCVLLDDMSGLDLCRMLRSDKQYNEPFIFLTTCTGGDQQAAGMKAGADYYITKPFDPDYLQEVVGKASDNARAYEALLRQLPQRQSAKNDHELSKRDRDILRITQKFMKENMGNSELDVNKLGRKLLLSRTKLYEKIKALTGKTPNELFRVYKLNYAASLLKEGKLNVTEVASQTGFSSVAFFSRSFKKHFGVSPKDYS